MATPPQQPAFQQQRDADVERLLASLRHLVQTSHRTQGSIERQNGFRAGYLSQVLTGRITLTLRHLLGILGALELAPSALFEEDNPIAAAPDPNLDEIRERLARYDEAFERLADRGLLDVKAPEEDRDRP